MSEESPRPADALATAPQRWRWKKWLGITVSVLVVTPVLVIAIWSWVALHYTYSGGDRAGFVQKFSRKGWICKTWEGELAMSNYPGAMQDRWLFTVRNDSVADAIRGQMGKQVKLTYEEHPQVPVSCFGDTRYFVTGVGSVAP